VSPVRYELGFYIPEDGILHSHRRENLKSYIFSEDIGCPDLGSSVEPPWNRIFLQEDIAVQLFNKNPAFY
jgi:hypothetical protein